MIDKVIARRNLAVNLWDRLSRIRPEYKWFADEMSRRTGERVHVSRIQKILEQTSSPEWSFVLNMAEALGCSVDDLAKKPTKSAEKRYFDRFERICEEIA